MEPIEIAFELFNGNQTLKRKAGDVEIVVDKPRCDGNMCFPMHVCVRCPKGIIYNQPFSIPFHKRKYSEEHITTPFDPKKDDALLKINVTRHFSRIIITIVESGKEEENMIEKRMSFDEFQEHVKSNDFIDNGGKMTIDLDKHIKIRKFEVNRKLGINIDGRTYVDLNNEYWHVHPLALTNSNVYIVCPYCGQIHIHSVKNGEYVGHRYAHCDYSKEFRLWTEAAKHEGYFINEPFEERHPDPI